MKSIITVTILHRPEGGIRVKSKDIAGLILSGENDEEVARSIAPSIHALLKAKGIPAISVEPDIPLADIVNGVRPNDVAVSIHHFSQEPETVGKVGNLRRQFIVTLEAA